MPGVVPVRGYRRVCDVWEAVPCLHPGLDFHGRGALLVTPFAY